MNQLKKLKRGKQVAEILVKYGLDELFDRAHIQQWLPNAIRKKLNPHKNWQSYSLYERIRMAVEELGTTYIKLGQLLSNRTDILPEAMIVELQKLQDKVEVQNIDVADKLWRELNIQANDFFDEINNTPIASASIGQVFKARLKNGQEVVLKIKREGIDEAIEADLLIIKDLAKFLEKHGETFQKIHLGRLLETFEKSLKEELSLNHERNNMAHFERNFRQDTRIVVPKVYDELSNNHILCMDFIHGTKVDDKNQLIKMGFQTQDIAILGLDLYMKQVLEHGFFHADPHPGNIFVTDEGKMAFIDFGAMGILLPPERERFEDFILYAMQKNVRKVMETVKLMAQDNVMIHDALLEKDLYELMYLLDGSNLSKLCLSDVLEQVRKIFNHNHITLPENYYLLIKGFIQIEGIGRHLYPDIHIFKVLQPYGQQILARRFSPKMLIGKGFDKLMTTSESWLGLPDDIKTFLYKLQHKDFRLEHTVEGLPQIHKTLERLALALIASSLFIGSSILVLANMPPKIYDTPVLGLIGFICAGILSLFILFGRK